MAKPVKARRHGPRNRHKLLRKVRVMKWINRLIVVFSIGYAFETIWPAAPIVGTMFGLVFGLNTIIGGAIALNIASKVRT